MTGVLERLRQNDDLAEKVGWVRGVNPGGLGRLGVATPRSLAGGVVGVAGGRGGCGWVVI